MRKYNFKNRTMLQNHGNKVFVISILAIEPTESIEFVRNFWKNCLITKHLRVYLMLSGFISSVFQN